jgi:hypothetical protein
MSIQPRPEELGADEFAIFIPTRSNEPLPPHLVPFFLGAVADGLMRSPDLPDSVRIELVGFSQGSLAARWKVFLRTPTGQIAAAGFVWMVLESLLTSESSQAQQCASEIIVVGKADYLSVITRDEGARKIDRSEFPGIEKLEAWKREGKAGNPWDSITREEDGLLLDGGPIQGTLGDGTMLVLPNSLEVTTAEQAPPLAADQSISAGFFMRTPSGRLVFIEDMGLSKAARMHVVNGQNDLSSQYLEKKVQLRFREGAKPKGEFAQQFARFAYIERIILQN